MTTRVESDSSQILFQFLAAAISIAFIAPHNLVVNAEEVFVFWGHNHKDKMFERDRIIRKSMVLFGEFGGEEKTLEKTN
jgi:hypothetical protein